MSPRLTVVGGISAQDPAQVRFTEHDGVVEAFPADRAYARQHIYGVVADIGRTVAAGDESRRQF
jgi:hypothetical protein